MDNKHDNDISADDLLAKLKANMAKTEESQDKFDTDADKKKKYRFRRTEKNISAVTENEILREMPEKNTTGFISPIPKSDIADLDIDALMKKYLPEDEYEKLSRKNTPVNWEQEEELVRTLTSIDTVRISQTEESNDENSVNQLAASEENGDKYDYDNKYSDDEAYTAPDRELFSALSDGGRVCDIPEDIDSGDGSDTRAVPLRQAVSQENTFFSDEIQEIRVSEINSDASEAVKADSDKTAEISVPEKSDIERNEAVPQNSDTIVFDLDNVSVNTIAEENNLLGNEDDKNTSLEKENKDIPTDSADLTEGVPETASESDFDETDANLMIAFGMDDELEKAMGKENADKLRSDMENLYPDDQTKKKKVREDRKTPIKEFISPVEAKEIFESYKTEFGKNALSLFGIIAIVIILFFYENITILGGHLPDALNPEYYPIVYIMTGLQFLFLGFAIAFQSLVKGIRGLIDRKPIPESFLPLILLVSVAYSIAVCFFEPGAVPVSFYFPSSICLLLSVLNERMDLRREIMTFNIVSSKRTKFALEKLELNDAELEAKAFDEFLPKQPAVFKINKTAFIDGYFHRTKAYPSIKLILKAFIPVSAAIVVASFIMGFIFMKSWQDSAMFAYTAFFFSLPATVFIAFGLPAFRASKLAFADNSAFVGEAALDEYTSAGSISFDDREVFPTSGVKLKSVKVFGSGRIDTVIYNVASIYSLLGGPLSDVLNVATADLGRSDNTEILSIDNEGVEAVVDGRHLYAGKADYLRKNGYIPVSDPDDEEIVEDGEISIMFLVCDDEVVAKLYVKYRIDPGFETTLKRLYKSGICVGVKTVDPNINDEMLSTKIKLSKYPVRVLKYSDISESRRGSDRTDSGIVSKKSAKALLRIFTLCDKIKHVTKANIAVNIITMVSGLAICAVVAALGNVAGVSSLYVALFQLFWIIPVYLMSKFMLL